MFGCILLHILVDPGLFNTAVQEKESASTARFEII